MKRVENRLMRTDGGERRTGAARMMTMTFPPLRQNDVHQLNEHIKRQPHPQREESRGVWRSMPEGGGNYPDQESATLLIRHEGIGRMRNNATDSMVLFTGT